MLNGEEYTDKSELIDGENQVVVSYSEYLTERGKRQFISHRISLLTHLIRQWKFN